MFTLFFFNLFIARERMNGQRRKKKSDSGFSMSAECLEKRTRSPIGLFRFGGSVCRRHKRSAVIFEKRKKEKGEKIVNENTEWAEIALCQHRTTSKEKFKKKKMWKNCACDHAKKNGKKERNTLSSSRFLSARAFPSIAHHRRRDR
jgi:hypothetical protein